LVWIQTDPSDPRGDFTRHRYAARIAVVRTRRVRWIQSEPMRGSPRTRGSEGKVNTPRDSEKPGIDCRALRRHYEPNSTRAVLHTCVYLSISCFLLLSYPSWKHSRQSSERSCKRVNGVNGFVGRYPRVRDCCDRPL
jgi:hypothetical protein